MTERIYMGPEGSEGYSGEVCRADTIIGSYRIIVCRDGIQWIIQRRTSVPEAPHSTYWRNTGYFRTRQSLVWVWIALTGEPVPDQIKRLPAHIAQRDHSTE
jgi:hypothetical protein